LAQVAQSARPGVWGRWGRPEPMVFLALMAPQGHRERLERLALRDLRGRTDLMGRAVFLEFRAPREPLAPLVWLGRLALLDLLGLRESLAQLAPWAR